MSLDIERDGSLDPNVLESESISKILVPTETTSLLEPDIKTSQDEEVSGGELAPIASTHVLPIIALLMVGVLISHADSTLLMATYTTITSSFSSPSSASFLTTAYTLSTCALQPLTGKLSDILGRKPLLLFSYLLFGTGCVLCGISSSITGVIAGRVVSGLGAAGMTVLVTVIITDLVPPREQAQWRSYVNVFATLGRSLGGPLGGWAADTIGWRWAFAGQGPLMAAAMVLVGLRLPGVGGNVKKGQPSTWHRIDFLGAILLSTTILALLGVLSLGGQVLPWSSPLIPTIFLTSIILGTAFVIWELKGAQEPVFPPELFIQRDVATPCVIGALQTAAQLGMMYSVPLYFLSTTSSSTTNAGAHLFPAVLGNTCGGLLSGYPIKKTGRYKSLTIFAALCQALSYGLLIVRWKGNTVWLEGMEIIPSGFGSGIAQSTTFVALVAGVRKEQVAVATGGLYLAGSVGMVLGIAGSTAVQMGTVGSLLGRALGVGSPIIRKIMEDVGAIAGLEDATREVVVECYVKSLEYCHLVSFGCAILALLVGLTIREKPIH